MKKAIRILLAVLLVAVIVVTFAACSEQDPCQANGHKWDDGTYTLAPTCKDVGKAIFRCKVCGEEEEREVPKTEEHKWDDGVITTEPTCHSQGVRTYTCSVCQTTKTEKVDPTGKHTKGEAVAQVDATCHSKGTKAYWLCTDCGAKLNEAGVVVTDADLEIDMLPHVWDNGTITKDPTCTEPGTKLFKCTNSGCIETFEQELEMTDHVFGRLVEKVDPTCTTDGHLAYYQCEECEQYFTEEHESVQWEQLFQEKLGHQERTLEKVDPTCQNTGLTEGTVCDRCGETLKAQQPLDKLPHTPVPYGDKAATCEAKGYQGGQECSVCHTVLVQPKEVPATGHSFYYVAHDDDEQHTVRCHNCDYNKLQDCQVGFIWESDGDYHWHVCTLCGGTCQHASHELDEAGKQCVICHEEITGVTIKAEGFDDHQVSNIPDALAYIKENYIGVAATIEIYDDRTVDNRERPLVLVDGMDVTLNLNGHTLTSRGATISAGTLTFHGGSVKGTINYNGGTLNFNEIESAEQNVTVVLGSSFTCDNAKVYFDGVLRTHKVVELWQHGEGERSHYHECAYCSAHLDEADCQVENKFDNANHWVECKTCHEKYDVTAHTMAYQNTGEGTHKHYCTKCSYVDSADAECTPDATENKGLHSDENDHWYVCASCNTEYGREGHNYGGYVHDENANTHTRVCEDCGRKDTAQCANLEHKYSDQQHWDECPLCHEKYNVANHVWTYEQGKDGYHTKSCTGCKVEAVREQCEAKVPADAHDPDHQLNTANGWYADADSHWKVCKYCGKQLEKEAHHFDKEESGEHCKVCGHLFFDVKISDGNGDVNSVPTIAEAFAWIKDHGSAATTYTVTLTHNRSDDSTATVTVPTGFNIVLNLAGFNVTYPNGALEITSGSLEVKGGTFTVNKVLYSGGTLKLPAGTYEFEITGTTCDKADVTVDGEHLAHQYPETWVKKSNTEHKHDCEFCGHEESELHTWGGAWEYDDGKLTHTRSCKCIDEQTEEHVTKTEECESEVKVVDGVSKNVCKACGKELPTDDIIAKLNSLYQDKDVTSSTYLEGTYILTGVITSFNQDSQGNSFVYIDVSGKKETLNIECYKIDLGSHKFSEFIVGAKLTVQGTLMCFVNFNTSAKTLEFQEGCDLIEIDKTVTYQVSFESEYFELTDSKGAALKSEYRVGEVVTFKIKEINAKKVVGIVTVNGETVEPDENGEYSFEVHGNVTIVITAADWGVETTKRVARLSFESDVTTNDEEINDYISSYNFTRDGITWTASSFSNYSKNWDYIATGHKTNKDAQLGTITTTQPIPFKITKLDVGILFPKYATNINNHNYVTSFKLVIAGNVTLSGGKVSAVTDVKKEITQTIQDPGNNKKVINYTFEIPEEYQSGCYFSLQIATKLVGNERNSGSSNGFVAVKYIDYYGLVMPECTHPEEFRTQVEAHAATCTKDGNKTYSICERCGQVFDEHGEKTTIEEMTEKALGHKYPDAWKSNDDGTHSKTCQRSDCDGGDEQTVTENCSEHFTWKNDGKKDGEHWQECTECHYQTKKAGHNFSESGGKQVCDDCGMEYCEHKSLTLHTEEQPTCTKDGHITYYQCDACNQRFASNDPKNLGEPLTDDQIVDEFHKQLGHDWHYVRKLNGGTAVEFGKHVQECSRFHETQNEGVCTIAEDPANTCSTCGHTYTTEEIFAALEKLDSGTLVSESTKFILQGTLGGNGGNWTLTVDVSGAQKQLALPSVGFGSFDAVVGSVITIHGALGKANGNLQVSQGTVTSCEYPMFAVNHNVTPEYGEITFEPNLKEGKLQYNAVATFTIQANNPWKVKEVTVNGDKVAAEGGKYSFTVKGEVTIDVEFVNRYIATEELYAHLSFDTDERANDGKTQVYTSYFKATRQQADGRNLTWYLTHFNNNNNADWDHVRAGRKYNGGNQPSDAYISVQLDAPISKIVVAMGYPSTKLNVTDCINNTTVKLIVATKATTNTNGAVTEIADGDILEEKTITLKELVGEANYNEYEVSLDTSKQADHQGEKLYYILHIYTNGTLKENGYVSVFSMDYYAMQGEVCTHPKEQVEPVAADRPCQEDGHQAYWHCKQCDRYYKEEGLQTEFDPFEKIPHDSGDEPIVVPATCTTPGCTYWQCKYCKGIAGEKDNSEYAGREEDKLMFNYVAPFEHSKNGELQITQCSDLDPDKQVVHNHYCALCHEIINDVAGAELEDHWSKTGTDLDDRGHSILCMLCGFEKIEEEHNSDGVNGSCSVCGHGAKPFTVGENYVDTLQAAIDALGETGGTIKLNMNYSTEGEVVEKFEVLCEGKVEINTGNFTLTLTAELEVTAESFTVKGKIVSETLIVSATTISVQADISGNVKFNGETTVGAHTFDNVTLESGTLALASGATIKGKLTVVSEYSTVTVASAAETTGYVQAVEVSGGTFTLQSGATIKGKLTVTAGKATIKGRVDEAEISGGELDLTEGGGVTKTLKMAVTTSTVMVKIGEGCLVGTLNIDVALANVANAQAEITVAQQVFGATLTVTGGATCDKLTKVKFNSASTPISHTYAEYTSVDSTYHSGVCDICKDTNSEIKHTLKYTQNDDGKTHKEECTDNCGYSAQTVECTYTIDKDGKKYCECGREQPANKVWKLVTNADNLEENMEITFVSADNKQIAGELGSNSYLKQISITTIADNKFSSLPDGAASFTLKADNSNWKFYCGQDSNKADTYLRISSTSNNNKLQISSTDSNNVWSIKITNGTAVILNTASTGTSLYLKYSSSNSRFSNYKSNSNMADFRIYALVFDSVSL